MVIKNIGVDYKMGSLIKSTILWFYMLSCKYFKKSIKMWDLLWTGTLDIGGFYQRQRPQFFLRLNFEFWVFFWQRNFLSWFIITNSWPIPGKDDDVTPYCEACKFMLSVNQLIVTEVSWSTEFISIIMSWSIEIDQLITATIGRNETPDKIFGKLKSCLCLNVSKPIAGPQRSFWLRWSQHPAGSTADEVWHPW